MKVLLIFGTTLVLLFNADFCENSMEQIEEVVPTEEENKGTAKIIFSRSPGPLNTGGTLDLMIYDPETKKTDLLLKGTVKRRGEYNATTCSDNSKIVFNTYRFSGWKLAIGDFNGDKITNVKKLTSRSNYEYNGMFSPDGTKIVYQEYNWGTNEIELFLTDKNGKNALPFCKPKLGNQNLDWTKDSQSIVFTLLNDGHLNISVQAVDEKSPKILSSGGANDCAPSTSKVSNKIAFLSDENGKIDLFVMDLEGENRINLTPDLKTIDADINSIWAYKTAWSPDGKQIVFNVLFNQNLEIFIINADGTGITQITKNNDTDISPFWMY